MVMKEHSSYRITTKFSHTLNKSCVSLCVAYVAISWCNEDRLTW